MQYLLCITKGSSGPVSSQSATLSRYMIYLMDIA